MYHLACTNCCSGLLPCGDINKAIHASSQSHVPRRVHLIPCTKLQQTADPMVGSRHGRAPVLPLKEVLTNCTLESLKMRVYGTPARFSNTLFSISTFAFTNCSTGRGPAKVLGSKLTPAAAKCQAGQDLEVLCQCSYGVRHAVAERPAAVSRNL